VPRFVIGLAHKECAPSYLKRRKFGEFGDTHYVTFYIVFMSEKHDGNLIQKIT